MAARTPYRSAPARAERARLVTLVDQRLLAVSFLLACVVGTLCFVEWPRAVHVSCAPNDDSMRCVATSRIRGLGLAAKRRQTTVGCAPDALAILPFLESDRGEAPPPLRQLSVRIEYRGGGRKHPSTKYLVASCGAAPVDLTAGHLGASEGGTLDRISAFQQALRAGQRATLDYDVGWGNPVFLFLGGLLALLSLLGGGRTRVAIDRGSDLLEVFYQAGFLFKIKHKAIRLGQVRDVLLVLATGHKNRTIYLPAVRLASGEVVHLGQHGYTDRAHGQGVVDRLRGLIGLKPDPKGADSAIEVSTGGGGGDG